MIKKEKNAIFTGYFREEQLISLQTLLHSRTVIESIDYVSTGAISYLEGDIIEIEISDPDRFSLGDTLKVTVYSPIGIFTFYSTVIARAEDAVMIFHPPEHQKRFGEKRDFPRVPISKGAWLKGLKPRNNSVETLEQPVLVGLRDISLGGVGFAIEQTLNIVESAMLTIQFEFENPFSCEAEVVRKKNETENFVYIGAKFVELRDPLFTFLRSYILRLQIEQYYKNKKVKERADGNRKYQSLL